MTDTGALREALRHGLIPFLRPEVLTTVTADHLLALPALRDLIAERDRAVAAVERADGLADELEVTASRYEYAAPGSHDAGARNAHRAIADRIRRAIDGSAEQ